MAPSAYTSLAAEEPDLSGLADELTGLVTACLQRVPRERPTSTAILAQLGPFTETRPGEHSYLSDAAMALIVQYQHNPLLASNQPAAEDSAADETSASYTELPASYVSGSRAKTTAAGGGPHLGRYFERLRRSARSDR